MSLTTNDLISNSILGQPRTSARKQFVILQSDKFPQHEVWKGPYSADKINLLKARYSQLTQWNCDHIVYPLRYESVEKAWYIVYPNLLDSPIDLNTTSVHQESFSSFTYRVIQRTGLIKMKDAFEMKQNEWIYSQLESLLQTLICCNVLNIGDMNFSNILCDVAQHTIYVIDIDESRGKEGTGEFFYLSRPPKKSIAEIWLTYQRPLYGKLQTYFQGLAMDETKKNRVLGLLVLEGSGTNLGQMQFGGLFAGSTTYSGLTLDVAKSALQKYIRRAMVEKALMAGFELYRMAEVGGKAAQSNMYNRLAVIAAEDIGPADLGTCLFVIQQVLNDDRSDYMLGVMIGLMCEAEKTRIMSHAYRAYCVPEGKAVAVQMGIELEPEASEEEGNYLKQHPLKIWKQGDNEEIKSAAELFYYRLKEGKMTCLTALGQYMERSKDIKVVARNRKTDPMVIIWELLKLEMDAQVWDVLFCAYWKFTEKRPFLMVAIMTILYKVASGLINVADEYITAWKSSETIGTLLRGEYTFEIDDYVVDMHTKAGRQKGKNSKDFATEGSQVTNQSQLFWNETLYRVYCCRE